MRVTLNLDLPDVLSEELQLAAELSGIPAPLWAAQAIECELASRRLPRVKPSAYGARIGRADECAEPEEYLVHWPMQKSPMSP